MPRKISAIKKYLLALSIVLSSSSSHLFGRVTRNPGGGAPAGVAARGVVVEKRTAVAGEKRCRVALRIAEDAGRERASASSGLVAAIVCVGGVVRSEAAWRMWCLKVDFELRGAEKRA